MSTVTVKPNPATIRVLLVDDSAVALAVMKRILAAAPEITVVGTARDGRQALELIPALDPTLICTDYQMPAMDGLELTRAVMAKFARPILVVSAAVSPADTRMVFPILEAGALDFIAKPQSAADAASAQEFISKIRLLSRVFVFGREQKLASPHLAAPAAQEVKAAVRMIAVGASTGGPHALQVVLSQLSADFAAPLVCVQHITAGFLRGLVDWLQSQCALTVKIAASGERPRAGIVYFPEEDMHLEINSRGCLVNSQGAPLCGHRPAVTVTFRSVAGYFGNAAIGVLLTGMGADGASGLQMMAQAGAFTIAQDEATSVVFGMPKEAIALGAARQVLPLNEIAPMLIKLVQNQRK